MTDKDKFTDEELDQLTDEEREALQSDDDFIDTDDEQDDDNEGTNDDQGQANDEAEDEGDDKGGDDNDGEQEGDQEGEQPGRDDGADPDEDEDKQPEPPQQYSPNLRADLPEDFKDQLSQIDTEKADLRKKYNEGDIDFDEYDQKREELDAKRRQLEQQQFKASIAEEMRQDRWLNYDVPRFLDEHPEYKPGSVLHRMLDQEVRTLQAQAHAEGKDVLDPSILEAAHKSIREGIAKDLGITPPAQQRKKASPPPKRDVPPTLGNVPAAEVEGTDGGRWAHLDRLAERDPSAFEEKLAALSDSEREQYLASQ